MTAITELENENRDRFEKPHSAKGAWGKSAPGASTGLMSLRFFSKQKETKHGQFMYSVQEQMLVGYNMRRYSFVATAAALYRRNSRLPPAVPDNVLESRNYALVCPLPCAIISEKHPVDI